MARVSDDRPATGDPRDQRDRVDRNLLGLLRAPLRNDSRVLSSCGSKVLFVLSGYELVLCVHENKPIERCHGAEPVSYTHLRAHETKANLVCRLLLEKKKKKAQKTK